MEAYARTGKVSDFSDTYRESEVGLRIASLPRQYHQ